MYVHLYFDLASLFFSVQGFLDFYGARMIALFVEVQWLSTKRECIPIPTFPEIQDPTFQLQNAGQEDKLSAMKSLIFILREDIIYSRTLSLLMAKLISKLVYIGCISILGRAD